ncbi:MAG: DsbA family protein [Deltaproteobacteria bacterium]|nr:DsbA family protein [Deltaproteobacteria bacterium]
MTISADLDRAKLTVVLDIRHPFAYLALRPAIELGQDAGVEINWLPLRSQTLRPPLASSPDDDRGIRHRLRRAQMIAREIAVYAEARGLQIDEPYRDGPSTAFELAWLWVRDAAAKSLEPFLEQAFRCYWALDLDVGSIEDVANVVEQCGLESVAFREWARDEAEAASSISEQLAQAGVFQTPAYLVGDEVFFGRQHLPMIRWILEDKDGPVPI